MNAIMAKIGKSLASAVLGTARNAISTSPYLSTTENAFVRSARAKSLNQFK